MQQQQTVFEQIGQYMVDSVDAPEWRAVFLHIDIVEQSVGLSGEYVDDDGIRRPFDTDADLQLAKALLAFHHASNENPKNRWNRANATLTSAYDFKLEYLWDQQLADEVAALI